MFYFILTLKCKIKYNKIERKKKFKVLKTNPIYELCCSTKSELVDY